METINRIILDEFQRKSDLVQQSSDSIDLRASLVLILATFLASETVKLIEQSRDRPLRMLPVAAAVFIAFSLVAAVISMWPREYRYPDPGGFKERVELARSKFAEDPRMAAHQDLLEKVLIKQSEDDRIEILAANTLHNQTTNLKRNDWLNASFYLAAIALALFLASSGAVYP